LEPATQIVLSGCLTFGIPLALALRELVVMRRGQGNNIPPPPPPPPEERPKPKPLPPCLQVNFDRLPPMTQVREQRVLELA